MNLADGDLVALWIKRSTRWVEFLTAVGSDHRTAFGRKVGEVHWLGSPDYGPWTWLGFFWEHEAFWFGYGFDGRHWRPLIEADARNPSARAWSVLKRQMPEVWTHQRTGNYLRLWAPIDLLPAGARAHARWLRERAQELHEYTLADT